MSDIQQYNLAKKFVNERKEQDQFIDIVDTVETIMHKYLKKED